VRAPPGSSPSIDLVDAARPPELLAAESFAPPCFEPSEPEPSPDADARDTADGRPCPVSSVLLQAVSERVTATARAVKVSRL
jgi:hypothetical protein